MAPVVQNSPARVQQAPDTRSADAELARQLIADINSGDPQRVSSGFSRLFTDIGQTLRIVEPLLAAPDHRTRAAATEILGALGLFARHDSPRIQALLNDDSAMVRIKAAWALSRISGEGGKSAIEAHREKERDPLVRAEMQGAWELYGQHGTWQQSVARMLLLKLGHSPQAESTPEGRSRIAEHLAQQISIAPDRRTGVFHSEVMLTALACLRSSEGDSKLAGMLAHGSDKLREITLRAIGGAKRSDLVDMVCGSLSDPDTTVRNQARSTLREFNTDRAYEVLEAAAKMTAAAKPKDPPLSNAENFAEIAQTKNYGEIPDLLKSISTFAAEDQKKLLTLASAALHDEAAWGPDTRNPLSRLMDAVPGLRHRSGRPVAHDSQAAQIINALAKAESLDAVQLAASMIADPKLPDELRVRAKLALEIEKSVYAETEISRLPKTGDKFLGKANRELEQYFGEFFQATLPVRYSIADLEGKLSIVGQLPVLAARESKARESVIRILLGAAQDFSEDQDAGKRDQLRASARAALRSFPPESYLPQLLDFGSPHPRLEQEIQTVIRVALTQEQTEGKGTLLRQCIAHSRSRMSELSAPINALSGAALALTIAPFLDETTGAELTKDAQCAFDTYLKADPSQVGFKLAAAGRLVNFDPRRAAAYALEAMQSLPNNEASLHDKAFEIIQHAYSKEENPVSRNRFLLEALKEAKLSIPAAADFIHRSEKLGIDNIFRFRRDAIDTVLTAREKFDAEQLAGAPKRQKAEGITDVAYLSADEDGNNSEAVIAYGHLSSMALQQNVRFLYFEHADKYALLRNGKAVGERGGADVILFSMHGTQDYANLGNRPPPGRYGRSDRNTVAAADMRMFAEDPGFAQMARPGAVAAMLSCSTGRGRLEAENLAGATMTAIPGLDELIAPTIPAGVNTLTVRPNGKLQLQYLADATESETHTLHIRRPNALRRFIFENLGVPSFR